MSIIVKSAALKATALAGAFVLLTAAGPLPDLTPVQNHAAIEEIAKLVAKDYVFPEKRDAIVSQLRVREKEGRYTIANPGLFAQTVSEDMVAFSHDKHMWFQLDPEGYKAALLPPDDTQAEAYFEALAARTNQGYDEMRILPGNVRYVNLASFAWSKKETPAVVADVARFLKGADAIIFDISGNGGGAAEAVRAIVSYFLPPDGRTLVTFHDGVTGKDDVSKVEPTLAGPRLTGIPLYVLTSHSTGSAAEEFAYHVKHFKLGTLIGTTTAGAANNDSIFPVAPFFLQSISTGRPEHGLTHSNWEGVGVAPDVEIDPANARDTAYAMALKSLLAAGREEHRNEYDWALAGVETRLHPFAIKADALAAYAGQYGTRKVWVDGGKLMYQRQDRDPTELKPMAADLFGFANSDEVRARFRREGGEVTGFDLLTADGQVIPNPRT